MKPRASAIAALSLAMSASVAFSGEKTGTEMLFDTATLDGVGFGTTLTYSHIRSADENITARIIEDGQMFVSLIKEGDSTLYLSSRSVRGYPYWAECFLVAYRTGEGLLRWKPEGLVRGVHGLVPSSWYRAGTPRAAAALEAFAGSPRPWDIIEEGS